MVVFMQIILSQEKDCFVDYSKVESVYCEEGISWDEIDVDIDVTAALEVSDLWYIVACMTNGDECTLGEYKTEEKCKSVLDWLIGELTDSRKIIKMP